MVKPMGCSFCEIVQRQESNVREVYRDDHVIAFFPLEPATLGHTLIIPREHIPDIWALDEDTAAHLAKAVVRLSKAVQIAVEPEGLNIIQSNGEVATQTVFHLHVHIVPRWTGDAVGRIWPPETNYSEEAKDYMWERLSEECQKMSKR